MVNGNVWLSSLVCEPFQKSILLDMHLQASAQVESAFVFFHLTAFVNKLRFDSLIRKTKQPCFMQWRKATF